MSQRWAARRDRRKGAGGRAVALVERAAPGRFPGARAVSNRGGRAVGNRVAADRRTRRRPTSARETAATSASETVRCGAGSCWRSPRVAPCCDARGDLGKNVYHTITLAHAAGPDAPARSGAAAPDVHEPARGERVQRARSCVLHRSGRFERRGRDGGHHGHRRRRHRGDVSQIRTTSTVRGLVAARRRARREARRRHR